MQRGRPTILLVEDNPDDEALMLRAFTKNRIEGEIIVTRDGVEALNHLFGSDGPKTEARPLPAVVLLDLKLPRIDGLEVLRRIRADARTALLPVVVLTTSGETLDLQQAYNLGANSYIRKPVDFERFEQVVALLARYWLEVNEAPNGAPRQAY